MIQFDTLISEGVYNMLYTGGMGNIAVTTAPFTEARLLAQQAYALARGGPLPYSDNDPSPGAGKFYAYTMGFYAQQISFRELQRYRYLVTLQDVSRAAVPFPDDANDRISRRRVVEERSPRSASSGMARPSTCSSATPRPSGSSRNWKSPSRCHSPKKPRSKTFSSTSSRRPRPRTIRASRSTSIPSAFKKRKSR